MWRKSYYVHSHYFLIFESSIIFLSCLTSAHAELAWVLPSSSSLSGHNWRLLWGYLVQMLQSASIQLAQALVRCNHLLLLLGQMQPSASHTGLGCFGCSYLPSLALDSAEYYHLPQLIWKLARIGATIHRISQGVLLCLLCLMGLGQAGNHCLPCLAQGLAGPDIIICLFWLCWALLSGPTLPPMGWVRQCHLSHPFAQEYRMSDSTILPCLISGLVDTTSPSFHRVWMDQDQPFNQRTGWLMCGKEAINPLKSIQVLFMSDLSLCSKLEYECPPHPWFYNLIPIKILSGITICMLHGEGNNSNI